MNQPKIRVGILENQSSIYFTLNGQFILNDSIRLNNRKLNVVADGSKILLKDGDKVILRSEECKFIAAIKDNGNGKQTSFEIENVVIGIDFHWEQREREIFQGDFSIVNVGGKLTLINEIEVEKYLQSVISSEMNSDSPFEYLKAHAIISRSWLLAQLDKRRNKSSNQEMIISENEKIIWFDKTDHEIFDVCADDHCQRYQGLTRLRNNQAVQAVKETSGIVLIYGDEICDARYSKCCGGITEEFQNVWNDEFKPYLKSVYDSENRVALLTQSEDKIVQFLKSTGDFYCNTKDENLLRNVLNDFDFTTKDFFRWKIEIKQLALKTLFEIKLGMDFGEIKALIPLERGKSGRIKKLKIVGTKKEFVIGKELEIRRTLSEKHLYSSAFVVEPVYKEGSEIPCKFILHGAGWGHGVGFCQIGGAVMASKGKTYEEILKHYFTDVDLKKIY